MSTPDEPVRVGEEITFAFVRDNGGVGTDVGTVPDGGVFLVNLYVVNGLPHLLDARREGYQWIRGRHAPDSLAAAALLSTFLLHPDGADPT